MKFYTILLFFTFIVSSIAVSCDHKHKNQPKINADNLQDDSGEALTTTAAAATIEESTEQQADPQNEPKSDEPQLQPEPQDGCSQSDDHERCCDNLNQHRAKFNDCCEYPMLVVLTSQRNECTKHCAEALPTPSNCCVLNCCLKKINVMNATEVRSEINAENFANSFLNSVHHDKKWIYPIMSAVASCHKETAVGREKLMADENLWTCEGKVPKYFYELVDCTYERNL
jgi:hypothetical protein